MTRKRRTHSPEFKARVALEALKELKPIHQIASENEVYPAQVAQWKKELKARMPELFERKVGQLTIERDWLEKKSKELGID